MKKPKERIDKLLVEKEFTTSCQRAQALLLAGRVLVGGAPVTKAGRLVDKDADIRIRGDEIPYVSRGGVKLAHAIDLFKICVRDKICLDVGASTGGFTDCLLQHGAAHVFAVDVGYGQMSPKIALDGRVTVIDRRNIRYLKPEAIPKPIDITVIDVSFISLESVLPVVDRFCKNTGFVIALIKPQFEVGRALVGEGGIVKDKGAHRLAVEKILKCAEKLGWVSGGVVPSPIEGAKGNKEFLALFEKRC